MEENKKVDSWEEEYASFCSAPHTKVNELLSDDIASTVRQDLDPSAWSVFSKVALVHAVVGSLTLLICPQFGFSLTSSHGLMHFLMKYGDTACMLGCGALFTGLSVLAVSLALRPEEVCVLKKTEVLQFAVLASLSLGAFICLGASIVASLGLVWALGSILGGALTLEIGWAYRRFTARRGLSRIPKTGGFAG